MRKRIDQLLVEKNLAPTRSRARDAILRGLVTVAGAQIKKPGQLIAATDQIAVAESAGLEYVSRGALKLNAALDHFGFSVEGRIALDVGASTGGFTQVLLSRGAKKVFAVDVGQSQLADSLRTHPRVVDLEQVDARQLTTTHVAERVTAVVADVSFISLTKVLPTVLPLTGPGAWLVVLVKPQFEVGREAIGKGGVVQDARARQQAVKDIETCILQQPGWANPQVLTSPIKGGSGNSEYLIGARRDG